MRVLVTGWFSTEDGEITAGDLLAGQGVRGWLEEAGVPHDMALASGFRGPGEVAASAVDPARYTHVVWVCGPVAPAKVARLLDRFAGCVRIAVGVSLTGDAGGRFDTVLPRDGEGHGSRPDLSLAGPPAATTPVVGVILAHPQPEYGERQRHAEAERLVRDLVRQSEMAPLVLDTRLDAVDELACATPAGFEALIARVDVVVTTRLHGLVLALRTGVPALAIDPIAGGAKVAGQAASLGWPAACTIEDARPARLAGMLRWCLTGEARAMAVASAEHGRRALARTRVHLLGLLGAP
jgi:hypothetical protein